VARWPAQHGKWTAPRDQAAAHVASAVGVEGAGCWRRKGEEVEFEFEEHHWMDLELAVHLDGLLRQHAFVPFVVRPALLWAWVGVHCELLAQGRERERGGPEPRDLHLRLRPCRRLPGLAERVGWDDGQFSEHQSSRGNLLQAQS